MQYDDPFNTLGLTVKPLTARAARELGHIAWIEGNDPGRAIAEMIAAVRTRPINCAIWLDDSAETKKLRRSVDDWRAGHALGNSFTYFSARARPVRSVSPAEVIGIDLRREFSRTALPCLDMLEAHVSMRLAAIDAAIGKMDTDFDFRADESLVTKTYLGPHIDGDYTQRSAGRRFIEAAGATTLLFSNDSVVSEMRQDRYGNDHPTWRLRAGKPVTAWQVPPNSLSLFTDCNHGWQPIFHAEPVTPPGEAEKRRTVFVYDSRVPLQPPAAPGLTDRIGILRTKVRDVLSL